jgi:dihydrofolate reductase
VGKVIAGMTMSLDGFIDAEKVNPDFSEFGDTPSFKEMIKNTGAVIMGRHTYDGMADPFCGLMMIMSSKLPFLS